MKRFGDFVVLIPYISSKLIAIYHLININTSWVFLIKITYILCMHAVA